MQNSLIEKYIQHNHFGRSLPMHFEIESPGVVNYFLKIQQNHLATPKSAHGGVISALADAAMGVAGLSAVCDENKVVSTVEYKLNFLAPAYLNDELKATAKVIRKGKRLMVIECVICSQNRSSEIVAIGVGTFNAYDAAKAGY